MFVLDTAAAGTTLKRFLCTQYMNFGCPLNEANERAQRAFFQRSPTVAKARADRVPPMEMQ
jgi:hypothetical protein